MKIIHVVAAIIVDGDRVFATQRGYGDWKDYWEFPGGKIELGETPEAALHREIMEELETEIAVGDRITTIEYDYPEFHLTKRTLLKMQNDLRSVLEKKGLKNYYTKPENLHLCLTRIVDYDDADKVLEVMQRVKLVPFSITTDGGWNYFGRYLCCIASPDNKYPADPYNRKVRSELTKAGIPYEKTPYHFGADAHILLFSNSRLPDKHHLDTSGFHWEPTTMEVRRVSLMREERLNNRNETKITVLGSVEA